MFLNSTSNARYLHVHTVFPIVSPFCSCTILHFVPPRSWVQTENSEILQLFPEKKRAIYCISFIRRCFLACLFCDNRFLHSMFLAAMFYRWVIMFPNKNEVPYFVQTQNDQIVGDVPLYFHYYWCISHISPYLLLKAAKKRHRFPCFPGSTAAFFWPWFCGAALAQRCIWAVAEFDTPCCVKWWYTGDIVWYYGCILTTCSAHMSNIILLV